MDLWRLNTRVLAENGGDGAGDGGSGSGTGDGSAQGGPDGGSIMSRGQQGAGAGDQGGDKGASGAGDGGDSGQGGDGKGAGGDKGGTSDAWQWADGIAGTGERPPWFKADKYKTVDQQARAAAELETKLGPAAELIGLPESGEYALPTFEPSEGVVGEFDPEDPLLKVFQETAKELGLSQKAHDAIVTKAAKALAEQNVAEEKATADAIASLGNNAEALIDGVEKTIKAQFGQETYAALDKAIGNDVAAFRALAALVGKLPDAQLAGAGAGTGAAFTKEDIEAEQFKVFPEGHKLAGQRMYDHDKTHRERVNAMWKQLYPGEDRQEVG